jgi:hypothetical protein
MVIFAALVSEGYATVGPVDRHEFLTIAALVAAVVLTAALSLLCGILATAFTLGPIARARIRANGGPFTHGDIIRVIGGKHEGLMTTVREKWQGDSVRIDLPTRQAEFDDVHSQLWIMRTERASSEQEGGQTTPKHMERG